LQIINTQIYTLNNNGPFVIFKVEIAAEAELKELSGNIDTLEKEENVNTDVLIDKA